MNDKVRSNGQKIFIIVAVAILLYFLFSSDFISSALVGAFGGIGVFFARAKHSGVGSSDRGAELDELDRRNTVNSGESDRLGEVNEELAHQVNERHDANKQMAEDSERVAGSVLETIRRHKSRARDSGREE